MPDIRKVIVTGGCGYIGSHTVVELAEAGIEPIIVDNLSNSRIEVLDGLARILGKRPAFFQVNCCDTGSFQNAIKASGKIDGVIHFAAFKSVGESVRNPLKYYSNNLGAMSETLVAMEEFGIPRLIFSSSCSVYGNPDVLPVTEDRLLGNPESPYAITKQVCEKMLMDLLTSGSKMDAVILRYFNPIGAHPSAHIGELPIGTPENLIPYVTQAAAGVRPPLVVYGNDYDTPDGTCIRDYIHVVDLARAHVFALNHAIGTAGVQFARPEIFNLGTGKGNSVMEVIHAFEKSTGKTVPFRIGPRRAGDVVKIYADVSKAEKEMGWKAALTLEDALKDAWRWEKRSKE